MLENKSIIWESKGRRPKWKSKSELAEKKYNVFISIDEKNRLYLKNSTILPQADEFTEKGLKQVKNADGGRNAEDKNPIRFG